MATVQQVEATIAGLIGRLDGVAPTSRAMLPSRRVIQTTCPDLDAKWYAEWRSGHLGEVTMESPSRRPDIRVVVDSDDLVALAEGRLNFATAYGDGRIRIDASMTDLLRLRASL